jgi:hypothetical protein
MMVRTLTATALSVGFLLSAPGAATAVPRRDTLELAVTGTAAAGASFSGTLHIQHFVARDGQVKAIVLVKGSLTSAAGVPLGTTLSGPHVVAVAVEAGARRASGERPLQAQQGAPCDLLHLEVGAIDLNVLGIQVTTLPVGVDLSGVEGGVLGQLVCTILETIGNVVGLVNLLNQLLGLLGGIV